jgi:uncharacterized MAPEG superfamily protein
MRALLFVLAILGFAAVARRVALALLRLLRGGLARVVAGETAAVRARRGDITGLSDASVQERRARRAQLTSLGIFSFWALLIITPALTPWPLALYATYSVLWLVPRSPARPS